MADDSQTPAEQAVSKNPSLKSAVEENVRKSAEQQMKVAKGMLDPTTLTDAASKTPEGDERRENLAELREREAQRMGGVSRDRNTDRTFLSNAVAELQTKHLELVRIVTTLEVRVSILEGLANTPRPAFKES